MTYDNIKSHKKQGFNLSLKESFLEIPRRVGGGGGGVGETDTQAVLR